MTIKEGGIRCPTFWLWKSVSHAADGRVTILLYGDFWDSEICFCSPPEGKQKSLRSTILDWCSGQIQSFQCGVSALVPLCLRGFELFWIEQDNNLIFSLPYVCTLAMRHESLVTSLFPLTFHLTCETFTRKKYISGKHTTGVKVAIQHRCVDKFWRLLH